jgi:apolipoprotein N-acyltransferase
MFEFDILTVITVVVLGIQLLHQANQKITLSKWLVPFSLGWVLSGLLWLMPFAEQGSKGAIAVSYLLIGTLIFNTLVLYGCSRLPNHFIPLKSTEIELIGSSMLKLIGTGLGVMGRNLLCSLFEIIDAVVDPQPRSSGLVKLNAN